MFALKKLRARRAPSNQAHVTNLKESPALLAADAAEAARRGFAEVETTVGVARYAPLNAISHPGRLADRPARCDDPVRGRGAPQPQLAILGLVTYAETLSVYGTEPVLRRRRRHAVVEGVPRLRLRLARRQGAVHVGHRLRGADGPRAGLLDALPRGALPRRDACGRFAGRPERLDLVRRARAVRARRHPGDPRRERDRGVARPGGCLRKRRDRLALGDPQDGEADGPVPARHRLRHLRLFGDAAPRQHVRRRQLRCRRHRRVAHDPARLAGRRRDRAGRRGGGAPRARAGGARGAGRLRRARASRRSPTPRSKPRRWATTRATCRTGTARPTSRQPTTSSHAGSPGSMSRLLSTGAGSGRSRRRSSRCSASGSRPTTCRRPRSSTPTDSSIRRSTTRTSYSGPGTGYRLEGERWRLLQSLPNVVDPGELLGSEADAEPVVLELGEAAKGSDPERSSSRSARHSQTRSGRRSQTTAIVRCSWRSATGFAALARSRASFASAALPTSRSSRMPGRSSPARASLSASSRRAPRSSTVPISSRSTTSSSSACRRCTPSRRIARWGGTRPDMRSGGASGPSRRSWTTTRARS